MVVRLTKLSYWYSRVTVHTWQWHPRGHLMRAFGFSGILWPIRGGFVRNLSKSLNPTPLHTDVMYMLPFAGCQPPDSSARATRDCRVPASPRRSMDQTAEVVPVWLDSPRDRLRCIRRLSTYPPSAQENPMLQRLVGAAPTRGPQWRATIKMRTERLPPAEGNGTAGGAPEGLVPTRSRTVGPARRPDGSAGRAGSGSRSGGGALEAGCASLSRAP